MKRTLIILMVLFSALKVFAFENAMIVHRHELMVGVVGGYYDSKNFINGLGAFYRGDFDLLRSLSIGAHLTAGYNLVSTNIIMGGGPDFKYQILKLAPIYGTLHAYGSFLIGNQQTIMGGGLEALLTFDIKYFYLTGSFGVTFDQYNYLWASTGNFLIASTYGLNIIYPLNKNLSLAGGATFSADNLNMGLSVNFFPGKTSPKRRKIRKIRKTR